MRTMFTIGAWHNPYFMGEVTMLATADAEKLYNDLVLASDKLVIVNEWKVNHPNLERDLGTDYDNWNLVIQDETKYGSAAEGLRDRLEKEAVVDQLPEISVDSGDLDAARFWIAAVDRMYVITANHTGKPVTTSQTTPVTTQTPSGKPGPTTAPGMVPPVEFPILPIAIGVAGAAILGLIIFRA